MADIAELAVHPSTIREYQVFVAAVEKKSLTEAARTLHLSVPSISKHLMKLESRLGVRLINRSTHEFEITTLGLSFYQQCKNILVQVSEAEKKIKFLTSEPSGKISVAFSRVLLTTNVIALFSDFEKQYPGIKFDIQISDDIENLIGNGVDFAFRIARMEDSGLIALPLLKTELIFCAAPSYIEKAGRPRTVSSLLEHQLIVPSYIKTSDFLRLFDIEKLDERAPFDPMNFTSSNDIQALLQAAISGMGVIATLDISAQNAFVNDQLVHLFPTKKFGSRKVYLVFHNREYMPKRMHLFKNFVLEYMNYYVGAKG